MSKKRTASFGGGQNQETFRVELLVSRSNLPRVGTSCVPETLSVLFGHSQFATSTDHGKRPKCF